MTTQGNATYALPDLRAALLARIRELAGTTEEATPGPWDVRHDRIIYTQGSRQVATVPGSVDVAGVIADAAFIDAHSPSVMAPIWEALEALVQMHAPTNECLVYCDRNPDCDGTEDKPCADSSNGEHMYPACGECRASGDDLHEGEEFFYRYPCPTARSLAAALGVSPDSPGGGPEERDEWCRVIPGDGPATRGLYGWDCSRCGHKEPPSLTFEQAEVARDQHIDVHVSFRKSWAAGGPPSAEAPAAHAEGEPGASS